MRGRWWPWHGVSVLADVAVGRARLRRIKGACCCKVESQAPLESLEVIQSTAIAARRQAGKKPARQAAGFQMNAVDGS